MSNLSGFLFLSARKAHVFLSVALLVLMAMAAGCQMKRVPIFEEPVPAIVWPDPPAPARIRYIGQLRTSADLKPVRSPLRALGEMFVGAVKPQPLYGPRAVVCTADGNRVWVADPGGRCLHMFDLIEREYQKITRIGDHPLATPVGLCLGPPGSIYVCDSESGRIARISDRNGALIESLRLPEEIERPVSVFFDEGRRELLVADSIAHDIKVLSETGRLRQIIGKRGIGPGEFNFPCAAVLHDGVIWVVDAMNHRVQGITREGEMVVSFGQVGDAPGDLALPKSISFDPDGNLYVVDSRFENVQVFDRSGRLLLFFGEEGREAGEFWLPSGMCIDILGRIWVCDSYNKRVQVFQYVLEPSEAVGGEPMELEPVERDMRLPVSEIGAGAGDGNGKTGP